MARKTPAASPWWLTLIRLLAAALLIFALAEPVLNPSRDAALKGTGPVAIVVDNGVVKQLNVEAKGEFKVSSADYVLTQL